MNNLTRCLIVLSQLLFTASIPAQSQFFLVVPNSLKGVEGNTGTTGPFLPYGIDSNSRFQQVYDASQFLARMPQGGWIEFMSVRVDQGTGGSITARLPDIQVNLSTTLREPDALSSVFSENIGADDTVVYVRGPLTFSVGGPLAFIGQIPFSHRFFYDPNLGNLLLDVRTYAGIPLPSQGPIPFLDAQNTVGDSISSIGSDDVFAPSGSTFQSIGLATEFFITPVPEPSSLALLAVGLGAMVFRRPVQRVLRRKELC